MADPVTGTDLAVFATLMGAISVATERLVEVTRGFWKWIGEGLLGLGEDRAGISSLLWPVLEEGETVNPMRPQLLAVVAGCVTVWLAWTPISQVIFPVWKNLTAGSEPTMGKVETVLALGLLSSGGSGLWNSVLGFANKLKLIGQG